MNDWRAEFYGVGNEITVSESEGEDIGTDDSR